MPKQIAHPDPQSQPPASVTCRTLAPVWLAGTEHAAGIDIAIPADHVPGLVQAGLVQPINAISEE